MHKDRENAKEFLEIVKNNLLDTIKFFEDYDYLLNEYRKERNQFNLLKLAINIVRGNIYMPYKQQFVDGRSFWGLERTINNGKVAIFVNNNDDKISKKEAMEYCWFNTDGHTFFKDKNFLNGCDFIIVNRENDFVQLYRKHVVDLIDVIDNLIIKNGCYDSDDIEKVAEILSEENFWLDNKRYVHIETKGVFYGALNPFYYKYNFDEISFVDSSKGVLTLNISEYGKLREIN